jgi:hypothetical protein
MLPDHQKIKSMKKINIDNKEYDRLQSKIQRECWLDTSKDYHTETEVNELLKEFEKAEYEQSKIEQHKIKKHKRWSPQESFGQIEINKKGKKGIVPQENMGTIYKEDSMTPSAREKPEEGSRLINVTEGIQKFTKTNPLSFGEQNTGGLSRIESNLYGVLQGTQKDIIMLDTEKKSKEKRDDLRKNLNSVTQGNGGLDKKLGSKEKKDENNLVDSDFSGPHSNLESVKQFHSNLESVKQYLVLRSNKTFNEAFKFFKIYTASIEVQRDEKLEKIHFAIPFECRNITTNIKTNLIYHTNRGSDQERLEDFFWKIEKYEIEMNMRRAISQIPVVNFFVCRWKTLKDLSYILVLTLNSLMLIMTESDYTVRGNSTTDYMVTSINTIKETFDGDGSSWKVDLFIA